ncbi:hypothetical protein PHISCL_10977 [Aspergillus sclerotialis]|uniref:Uncharacterized protein n=1 Tax=Aspergillus sclerotialis TaxID=2070753 RepID=A0A3A2Z1D9_9EURO|nr:hypothetical protein PHISCL_10977 [Aspergillus sclerotialis]
MVQPAGTRDRDPVLEDAGGPALHERSAAVCSGRRGKTWRGESHLEQSELQARPQPILNQVPGSDKVASG